MEAYRQISKEKLEERLDIHEQYLTSYQEYGELMELEGVDLNDTDLSNRNLMKAKFRHCSFIGVNFQRTLLDFAKFEDCYLDDVNFAEAGLGSTSFIRSTFDEKYGSHNNFEHIEGDGIEFEDCIMKWASFSGGKMREAAFRNVRMESVYFGHCDLKVSAFENVNIQHISIEVCDLTSSVFKGVHIECGSIDRSNFWKADLTGCVWKTCGMYDNIFDPRLVRPDQIKDLDRDYFTMIREKEPRFCR